MYAMTSTFYGFLSDPENKVDTEIFLKIFLEITGYEAVRQGKTFC